MIVRWLRAWWRWSTGGRLHAAAGFGGPLLLLLLALSQAAGGGSGPASAPRPTPSVPALAAGSTQEASTPAASIAPPEPTQSPPPATATQPPALLPTTAPLPTATQPPAPPQATTPASAPGTSLATVERVIDGDTFVLSDGSRVRLIGVDTPETVDPSRPVGCFGPQASAYTKRLLEGATVRLEKDVSETDRYGRLLRYVYLEDGSMLNELLLQDGYAVVATFPPDVKYVQRFLADQAEARSAGRGLWSACVTPPAGATQ